MQTEVFPFTLFALGGMMTFCAANDLLTMFVALEVLSLPLYLMCGLARRRRLLSQEAAVKYFLLGAFASAFFLYGLALLYGYAGSVRLADIAAAAAGSQPLGRAAARRARAARRRAAVQGLGRPVPHLDARTSTRARRRRSPRSWRPAPRSPRSARILRVLYVAFGDSRWEWRGGAVGRRHRVDGDRRGARAHPDRRQADGRLLVGGARRLPAARCDGDHRGRASRARCSTCWPTASPRSACSAVISLVRDADGEATHLSQWAGLAKRSPVVAGVDDVPPARPRRHPADQRLHRQVRGVLGGARRRHGAAGGHRAWWPARSPRSSTCG